MKLVIVSDRLGEISEGFGIDLEKCLESLEKLVISSYSLGGMSGRFGVSDFLDVLPPLYLFSSRKTRGQWPYSASVLQILFLAASRGQIRTQI